MLQTDFDQRGTRHWGALTTALGLALLGFLAFSEPMSSLSVTLAQKVETTFEDEIDSGRDFLRRRRWEDALKSFKRANEMKGKTCAECFFLMAQAYMGLEAYANVVQSSDKVVELAGSDTKLQAEAFNLKGIAMHRQSKSKDQKKLQDAEAALRQALALNTDLSEVYYNLGVVLLQQNRDSEGVAELKKFLEVAPKQFNSPDARKMIDNPRRAREPYAPDFSITTAAGEYISLEDLQGKVVLLDFWATWCGPCVASLPSLRELNKRYSKEPSFMMIGISSDNDEEKWRAFTASEKMVWPQYWDRDRHVQRVFGVRAFPTYIVIDHEGIIRYRASGMGFEREAALNDAIRKQVKIVAKATASN
jgi:thiol-disulfide isomerase/thioredoxin